ncbi:MAG: hypothetical protein RML57_06765 [Acidobacteriota bacterium]|nr:hypothetical protein [Acidobacteriota bacterium]
MSEQVTIPSQHQIRAELEAMLLRDLLGPAGGDNEELTERAVWDRYLVGVLAPSHAAELAANTKTSASDTPGLPADDDDDIPFVPDELAKGGSDTTDDGVTDADILVAQARLPSSFGLSFCVAGEAKAIKVSARWGQYKREKREEQSDGQGNPLKVWKRYGRGGELTIPPKLGPIHPQAPDPDCPDVYVKGQVRRRAEGMRARCSLSRCFW